MSLRDNLDLTTASGRHIFQIIAAVAKLERTLINQLDSAQGTASARKGVGITIPAQSMTT